ncbi:hypothetical protein [Teredinibacter haidensis]|uniref:hypothetical protein n=1 Tax=Teredinibacter haidensis TaxID=2731755 RepID=UPI001587FBC9|nr:hypothetical protein [Teredinibacter haidensis]
MMNLNYRIPHTAYRIPHTGNGSCLVWLSLILSPFINRKIAGWFAALPYGANGNNVTNERAQLFLRQEKISAFQANTNQTFLLSKALNLHLFTPHAY